MSAFMKKISLISSFLLLLTWYGCQQQEEPKTEEDIARVLMDSTKFTTVTWQDSIKDFGKISMGEKVKITFNCTNTGPRPLYISDVRPGCGCTLAEYTKEPIPPGGEGKVVAEFDSNKSHPGTVRKTVFVRTNTKVDRSTYLIFSGEILESDSTSVSEQ